MYGVRPRFPESISSIWINLIERCWKQDPSYRPSFAEIVEDLESDKFVNESIDRPLFEKYKESLKLRRIDSQYKRVIELEQKVTTQADQILDLTKQVTSLQEKLNQPGEKKSTSNAPIGKGDFIGEEDLEFLRVVKKIGEGATSIVYKVVDTRTSRVMCKKTLKFQDESNAFRSIQGAYKEFDALRLVRHPNICSIIGMNAAEPINGDDPNGPTTISLYLEFLSRNLKECIEKSLLDNTLKVRIVIDIVHALGFIHKHGMIHRDVKVENIMLNSGFDAKIVDFGLVRIDECFNNYSFVSNSLTKGVGTLAYMSPEMANEEEYDNKTDVFSFGIVLHYLFVGRIPKYGLKDKMLGKPMPIPEASSQISEFCIDLISRCTRNKPEERPSFEEILNDLREHGYGLADEIDRDLIEKRDNELTSFESTQK